MSKRTRRIPQTQPSKDSFRGLNTAEAKIYQTQIVPVLNDLVGHFLQFAPKTSEVSYLELETMLTTSPIIAIALEVKALFTLSALGKYRNSDPKIQEYVLKSEQGVQGRFKQAIAKSLIKNFVGWSGHEFTYKQGDDGLWYLDRLIYLSPKLSRFRGMEGDVTQVYYSTNWGYKEVPIEKIFHLANQDFLDLSSSPYGLPCARRMLALWKSFQVVMASLMVAAPKQAFPFLVGYTDTNKQVVKFDADGIPMTDPNTGAYIQQSAANQLALALQGVQNQSAVVTDKANKIEAIAQQSDGKLLFSAINLIVKLILLTVLIPSVPLLQGDTGSGDSNLAKVQLEFMYELAANDMELVAHKIVDQLHKPLIIANFGEQDDYGYYEINRELSPTTQKIFNLIGDLTQKGVLEQGNLELGTQILKDLGMPYLSLGSSNIGNI